MLCERKAMIITMFICLILATALAVLFILLFLSADKNISGLLVSAMIDTETEKIADLTAEMNVLVARVRAMTANKQPIEKRDQKKAKALKKKIEESEKRTKDYEAHGVGLLDLPPLAGYRIMQLLRMDQNNGFVATINAKCLQFKERREAMNYTFYLISSLLGNGLLGAAMLFLGAAIGLAMGLGTKALVIGVVLCAVFVILGYLPYDAMNAKIRIRSEEIEHDFPRVVSKLALLTVSGLDVNGAWNLVALSDTTTLYREMQRVTVDIQHNITPTEAYSRFIRRCSSNYTTKLATAIMQNLSKGNSEIVTLLRTLNNESWSEYRHTAKRRGEQISSKLMIPTLLMFAGILILIIVPVVGGFNF